MRPMTPRVPMWAPPSPETDTPPATHQRRGEGRRIAALVRPPRRFGGTEPRHSRHFHRQVAWRHNVHDADRACAADWWLLERSRDAGGGWELPQAAIQKIAAVEHVGDTGVLPPIAPFTRREAQRKRGPHKASLYRGPTCMATNRGVTAGTETAQNG